MGCNLVVLKSTVLDLPLAEMKINFVSRISRAIIIEDNLFISLVMLNFLFNVRKLIARLERNAHRLTRLTCSCSELKVNLYDESF